MPGVSAFSGFGHPATITVVAILILSRALSNSGAVEHLSKVLAPAAGTPATHIGALSLVATPLSAIMNNIGALSLLMPVAIQSAVQSRAIAGRCPHAAFLCLHPWRLDHTDRHAAKTSSSLIIVATVSDSAFGMFAFTPVGGVIAIVGVAFIALIGWRLIPKARLKFSEEKELFEIDDYVAEITVGEDSSVVGMSIHDLHDDAAEDDVKILGLVREGTRGYLRVRYLPLRPGDRLVVEAPPAALTSYVKKTDLELSGTASDGGRRSRGRKTPCWSKQ